ncbi:MAG: transketolase [Candidatus Atribacteria bacterium]|nr:transketolase [Candidatus Atribacteria bacterium]
MFINKELEKKLKNLTIESKILTMKMFHESGQGGHYGGSFSSAEFLTVLYNGILKIDPKNPNWKERDHFILSRGHIGGLFVAVLALRGFFGKEIFSTYDKLDSAIGIHTTPKIPGCEFAAGSLGHGLSVGLGVALAKRIDKLSSRVFVYMGDGEIDEGSVWEAAMAASKYKLDNLTATIDRNMMNFEGNTEDIMPLEPLEDKWKSFGWAVKTVDGHNVAELYDILSSLPIEETKPSCIITKTIKGKGIPCMEGNWEYHNAKISDEDYEKYYKLLEKSKCN